MPIPILPANVNAMASIQPPAAIGSISTPPSLDGALGGGQAFSSVLTEAISKVESFQNNAQQSVDRFLNGEGEEIHKVALSAEQASLSFDLFLQVRNKVVTAYQEVMRMQL
jgi:flagellar hook-basal body complex protein FliE